MPREVTTRELAAELDTSHQNLSALLRRTTEKLVDKSFVGPPATEGLTGSDRDGS